MIIAPLIISKKIELLNTIVVKERSGNLSVAFYIYQLRSARFGNFVDFIQFHNIIFSYSRNNSGNSIILGWDLIDFN